MVSDRRHHNYIRKNLFYSIGNHPGEVSVVGLRLPPDVMRCVISSPNYRVNRLVLQLVEKKIKRLKGKITIPLIAPPISRQLSIRFSNDSISAAHRLIASSGGIGNVEEVRVDIRNVGYFKYFTSGGLLLLSIWFIFENVDDIVLRVQYLVLLRANLSRLKCTLILWHKECGSIILAHKLWSRYLVSYPMAPLHTSLI